MSVNCTKCGREIFGSETSCRRCKPWSDVSEIEVERDTLRAKLDIAVKALETISIRGVSGNFDEMDLARIAKDALAQIVEVK